MKKSHQDRRMNVEGLVTFCAYDVYLCLRNFVVGHCRNLIDQNSSCFMRGDFLPNIYCCNM